MANPPKTNTFIGSSREAMQLANAVHSQISFHTQVTPWYTGVFNGNEYTMESLEKELDQHDFGVFIFAPDDVALHRNNYVFITRDNTLFEMGLFWGKLRRNRVFAIVPNEVKERDDLIKGETVGDFHLLSDLQGLTLFKYELRTDDRHEAAVSVACQQIIKKMQEHGFYTDPRDQLAQKELELQQKQSLLHFFWQYNRNVTVPGTKEKYEALSEAVRNSILPPDGFRVTGSAFWQKKDNDGIGQVGGNVGKNKFYPFSANHGKAEGEEIILVVDVYLSGEWSFYKDEDVAQLYVLCYPIGTKHVLSVHFSGNKQLTDTDLSSIVNMNNDLLRTINHLIGGDSE
ncbi:nucleotide-binding protein [Paenibacillus alginolyticus]|uniref:TIR domain-containing protein n=1 Tax=Paenibacillus alginolyticus TaxID=59839 RepID=UPI0004193094|nr:TIR domain-containing protein [Paenibacillus alginolyticus]MCY9666447.1 nucleotide-binding protein [Paenibacillus alginolyticus]